MLPSTSPREILFRCPPFTPWNLPFFTVESTLSSPCSRFDPPLSHQGATLAHLDSLPSLAESRILPTAPLDTRSMTSLISFCTVQLRTFCTSHSLATLCLFTTSGPGPGDLPGFWGSMVSRNSPIPRKGSGNQQQQHLIRDLCLSNRRLNSLHVDQLS